MTARSSNWLFQRSVGSDLERAQTSEHCFICMRQIFIPNFFPQCFGLKQIEAIRFWNGFYDKSGQTDCSKEMWVPILKGLKHLNTVLAVRVHQKLPFHNIEPNGQMYVQKGWWTKYKLVLRISGFTAETFHYHCSWLLY